MNLSGFAAGPYKTNTYLLEHAGAVTVVDPGMHTHDRIIAHLHEHSLTLEAIILTHGHLDHTRDAGDLARRFNVPVYIHPEDAFMLQAGKGGTPQTRALFDAEHMTPIEDLRLLVPGEKVTFGGREFKVFHAPGHSPGSVLLVAEDFALVGDVIFRGSVGRTDLAFADPAAMEATLRGPVWGLADELTLLPGHGPTTTMRAERVSNPFLTSLGR